MDGEKSTLLGGEGLELLRFFKVWLRFVRKGVVLATVA